ncbi:MAG: acyl-CoA dehydratase activase [Candidatus Bathyarchaeia archaeon]
MFIGIDVGSLATKVLVLEDTKIVSYSIVPTGADSMEAVNKAYETAIKKASLSVNDIEYVVSTGYGRFRVPLANEQVTEITCQARGVYWLFPTVRTIIDIGGQDSKIISLNDDGRVINFTMNDKCAAGTGRFLEVMAHALEVDLENLGKLSLESKSEVNISSTCTVFAESEVIQQIMLGTPKADIIAGILRAIVNRIYGLIMRGIKLEEDIVLTGGVAKNVGILKAFEDKLGCKIQVPEEPQVTGALGAALIAHARTV